MLLENASRVVERPSQPVRGLSRLEQTFVFLGGIAPSEADIELKHRCGC